MTNESLPPLPPLPNDHDHGAEPEREGQSHTELSHAGHAHPEQVDAPPAYAEPAGVEPLRDESGALESNLASSQTQELAELLLGAELTLATAESLTGGALAAEIVRVPGISESFRGGVVAYHSEVKRSVLGVERDLLVARGAVDPDVAIQMAKGVREVVAVDDRRADIGLSTTGVAGPDPSDGQDAGVVFVGISSLWGDKAVELDFRSLVRADDPVGSRQRIRQATIEAAIFNLLEFLHTEGES